MSNNQLMNGDKNVLFDHINKFNTTRQLAVLVTGNIILFNTNVFL